MRHEAKGLCQCPTGLRVRRVTLMEQRKRSLKARIGQIGVKSGKLIRSYQALVHNCSRRKRTEIRTAGSFGFYLLTKTEEKLLQVLCLFGGAEETLSHSGERIKSPWTDYRGVGGNSPPAETPQPVPFR